MSSIHEHIPLIGPIEGNYYKFTRLGHQDVVTLLELAALLLTEGFERLQLRVSFVRELSQGIALDENGELDPQKAKEYMGMLTMAFGIQDFYNKFVGFLSEITYKTDESGREKRAFVTVEEFKDRDLFPALTLPQLLLYLLVHPDFFLLKEAVVAGMAIPFFHQALEDVSALADEGLTEAMSKLQTNLSPASGDTQS